MPLEPTEALLILRIALGLYWVDHGLRLFLHQRGNKGQLDKSMSTLKPSNIVGARLLNSIKQDYQAFSTVIPLAMLFSGLLLTVGILSFLAAISTVLISASIIVMEPKAPGAVRNLSILCVLGLVIASSTTLSFFSPFVV